MIKETLYQETLNGLSIKIYQDEDGVSPNEWGDDNLFLVGYHRDFSVAGPMEKERGETGKGRPLVTREETAACFAASYGQRPAWLMEKYHVFALEAYIHGGVVLALASEGNFPDRQWDVSLLGAVFVAKSEWKTRAKARAAALDLIKTWNDALSGNVYGFVVEDKKGMRVHSCWGFYGDYDGDGGALEAAREHVRALTNKGKTDHTGQYLFPFAPELQPQVVEK